MEERSAARSGRSEEAEEERRSPEIGAERRSTRRAHSVSLIRPENRMPRDKVILACVDCKERNYDTTKNKRLHPERVEYRKYCPRCKGHRQHKETK